MAGGMVGLLVMSVLVAAWILVPRKRVLKKPVAARVDPLQRRDAMFLVFLPEIEPGRADVDGGHAVDHEERQLGTGFGDALAAPILDPDGELPDLGLADKHADVTPRRNLRLTEQLAFTAEDEY